MAKKKPTHQPKSAENPPKMEENPPKIEEKPPKMEENQPPPAANENPSGNDKEKLKNLHSLNSMLLNETVKKREEIKALESELTRSNSEVEALRAELTRANSEAEVVREVVSVFMESEVVGSLRREKEEAEKRLEEMEKAKFDGDYEIGLLKKLEKDLRNEIKMEKEGALQANREKSELTQQLGVRVGEVNRLREKERSAVEELEGVKLKYEVSEKAVLKKEKEVELVRRELRLMGEKCDDLERIIEGLKCEKEAILRENVELGKNKEGMNVKIIELEKEVDELSVVVLSVREDEEKWRSKFFELERSNAVSVAELEDVKKGLSDLLEVKNDKEREIERLKCEKSSVKARLSEVEKEVESGNQAKEELIEVERKFKELENGLIVMEKKYQGELALMEESYSNSIEENKKLVSKIDDQKSELSRVLSERDDVKKRLDEENKNGVTLQVKVSKMSKRIEENEKVMEGLKIGRDTLVGEKKEIESKYRKLMEDKELIEKDYAKYKGLVNDLESSMKSKTEMLELVVNMVRKTVKQLSVEKSEDEGMKSNEGGMNEEIELEPVMAELEAMRSVLKSREEKVGAIQEQMESLQSCLLEEKKKSFWTLISSATAILAAVVCYASRVR